VSVKLTIWQKGLTRLLDTMPYRKKIESMTVYSILQQKIPEYIAAHRVPHYGHCRKTVPFLQLLKKQNCTAGSRASTATQTG